MGVSLPYLNPNLNPNLNDDLTLKSDKLVTEVGAGGDSAMGVVSGAGIRHFLGSAGAHFQK